MTLQRYEDHRGRRVWAHSKAMAIRMLGYGQRRGRTLVSQEMKG